MDEQIIALRYARALLELAQEKGTVEEVKVQLKGFLHLLEENSELRKFLLHPVIRFKDKYVLLDEVCQGQQLLPYTRRFFHLLIKKKRLHLLEYIFKLYQDLALVLKRKIRVEVESAQPLTENACDSLVNRLKGILKKDVELLTRVNPALIGGLKVRFGDTVYDASIKRRLGLIGEELLWKLNQKR